jgi:O-antigen/teichoic acid export membrane protein
MALPRHLLGSVAIQGLGAAATFAVGVAIAAGQGPEAQGRYGLLRTVADLLLALALFGLPQSMVHALNQRGASPAGLERLSLRYAALLLGAALLVCALLAAAGGGALLPNWLDGPTALLALLVGSAGWILQGLLRVLALCRGTAVQFAWASVVPALTLLAAVLVLLAARSQRYELALAASGIASALIARWQLRPLRAQAGWRNGSPAPLSGLLADGTHAFAQTAALALQPWLTLLLMRSQGASVAEVGTFVFAAYVFQAFALPTSFVAPLLFARISRSVGAGRRYPAAGTLVRAVLWMAPLSLLAMAVLPWAVVALFGPAYAPAVPACVVLALGGPLLVANRLGVSVLFGHGRFRLASVHALLRGLAVPAGLLLAWSSGRLEVVTGAAVGWVIAEAAGVAALVMMWKRLPLRGGNEELQ